MCKYLTTATQRLCVHTPDSRYAKLKVGHMVLRFAKVHVWPMDGQLVPCGAAGTPKNGPESIS